MLLQDLNSDATRHLRWLAEAGTIPITVFTDLPYRAAALIKEMKL
ncbi:MAG: RNA-binding protein [Gammaproteobacteria bacterium]